MNNTLVPLKHTTNIEDTSSPLISSHTLMSRSPKLDVIPPGKREEEEPKIEDRPQSPTPEQQEHRHIEERPQSPTPEQQHQRKIEDQQHIKNEEVKSKNLLKGKPIIFVSGGPGMKRNDLNIIIYKILL